MVTVRREFIRETSLQDAEFIRETSLQDAEFIRETSLQDADFIRETSLQDATKQDIAVVYCAVGLTPSRLVKLS